MPPTLAGLVDALGRSKQAEYDAVMAEYAALPGAATDEDRIALLHQAGRVVSTTVIAPLPATVGDLRDRRRDAARRRSTTGTGDLVAPARRRDDRSAALLDAITAFVPTVAAVDQTPFEIGALRDSVLALAGDLRAAAAQLRGRRRRRASPPPTDALAARPTATGDKAQAAAADARQGPARRGLHRCCRSSRSPAAGWPSGRTRGRTGRTC